MKIVKTLESKVELKEKEVKYIYRILEETYKNDLAFGIEVERQDAEKGKVVNIERDVIKKISNKLDKVEILLNRLCDGNVSPIHLVDILGQSVDEYVEDFNF